MIGSGYGFQGGYRSETQAWRIAVRELRYKRNSPIRSGLMESIQNRISCRVGYFWRMYVSALT